MPFLGPSAVGVAPGPGATEGERGDSGRIPRISGMERGER